MSALSGSLQIVNWRTHLKFPEEATLSSEAKDLISRLLCNVSQRLGSKGADEIKVLYGVSWSKLLDLNLVANESNYLDAFPIFRCTHGLKVLIGTGYIKWKLHLFLRSKMN